MDEAMDFEELMKVIPDGLKKKFKNELGGIEKQFNQE
jgi:hypothetical protein